MADLLARGKDADRIPNLDETRCLPKIMRSRNHRSAMVREKKLFFLRRGEKMRAGWTLELDLEERERTTHQFP